MVISSTEAGLKSQGRVYLGAGSMADLVYFQSTIRLRDACRIVDVVSGMGTRSIPIGSGLVHPMPCAAGSSTAKRRGTLDDVRFNVGRMIRVALRRLGMFRWYRPVPELPCRCADLLVREARDSTLKGRLLHSMLRLLGPCACPSNAAPRSSPVWLQRTLPAVPTLPCRAKQQIQPCNLSD